MKKSNIYKFIKSIVDVILVVLLLFLSIKKGGFYKSDNLVFHLIITFVGLSYIISLYVMNILKKYIRKKDEIRIKGNEKNKIDVIEILLLILSISYLLPIVFNNYSNLSDSIFEMIRYFNTYIIYVIVKNSDNKKMYINGILGIVFIQCLLGVDGLANRYLLPILNKFNSGYLTSNNLTRMSGTIQYANVFSLLCILANVYLIDKLKRRKSISNTNLIDYFFIFVFTSSIILSKSRVILVILLCYIIYIFVSRKSYNKQLIGINLLLSVVYATIFMKQLYINVNIIYTLTFSFYMLVILLFLFKDKILELIEKVKEILYKKVKNTKVIYIIVFVMLIIYLLIGICIKIPIKLSSNVSQNYIERNIYDLDKGNLNEIYIKIKRVNEDSRYKVDILEINEKSESDIIQTYNYYSSITDSFEFEYIPKDDFKNLVIKIYCQKDSIKVEQIKVNDKNNYIDYLLLPTDIVYRTIDSLNSDSSFKDRVYFAKDAISLIKLNFKNFFIGLGGEGFKNTYEIVKSNNYSSTEIHNVYLQIFVESGIIGFCIFISLVIVSLKKSKFTIIKLLLIIFYITSIFDLNFSYMFVMAVYSILLALLEEKDKVNINSKKDKNCNKILVTIEFCKTFACTFMGFIILIILIKSNIAYYMKVPKLDDEKFTFEQIVESVQKQEIRVCLDPYENDYRQSLHLEYKKYLDILELYLKEANDSNSKFSQTEKDLTILKDEYDIIIENMEKNLIEMKYNDKYIDI